MTISLSVGLTTVQLNPDLFWEDENNWHPVEQTSERTITGALVVQVAERIAGRPITLKPEDDASGATEHTDLEQLRNWAAVPGQEMTLTIRGESRTVIFRHHDGAAIEARPWVHRSDVQSGDWYLATFRFMEM